MATASVDAVNRPPPPSWRGSVAFAHRRQFAWKTALLALITLALAPVVLWKHALAAQAYLVLLVVVHVSALAVFVVRTRREDIAPSPFGLFWRAVGLAVAVALLTMIRLDGASPWFWPSLAGIWAVHTAGLSVLHIRAADGTTCPFVPEAFRTKSRA
jgi:hypothetical protein